MDLDTQTTEQMGTNTLSPKEMVQYRKYTEGYTISEKIIKFGNNLVDMMFYNKLNFSEKRKIGRTK